MRARTVPDHARRQHAAARLADRPRRSSPGRFPPRVRARELWRIPPEPCWQGPGRRDDPRHPRAGGSRPRHRHGRRDPPRKLFEPVRDRARGRRPRQPGHGARSQRTSESRCRASSARSAAGTPSACATSNSCAAHTTRPREGHGAGPVHDVAAGADRPLRRQPRASPPLDYATALNAEIRDLFAAGADVVQIDEPYMQARPDEARAVRAQGAEPRARRRPGHDRGAHLLRLRGDHPRAPVRLLVPAGARRLQLPAGLARDRAAEARLLDPQARSTARRSCSACSTSAVPRSRRRRPWRRASGARCRSCARRTSSSRPTAA